MKEGRLSPERLAAYRKLEREQAYLRRRQSYQELMKRKRVNKRYVRASRRRERLGLGREQQGGRGE